MPEAAWAPEEPEAPEVPEVAWAPEAPEVPEVAWVPWVDLLCFNRTLYCNHLQLLCYAVNCPITKR